MVSRTLIEGSRDNRTAVVVDAFREADVKPRCLSAVLYAALLLCEYINGIAHTEFNGEKLFLVVVVPMNDFVNPCGPQEHLGPEYRSRFLRNFVAENGGQPYCKAASDLNGYSIMKIDISGLATAA